MQIDWFTVGAQTLNFLILVWLLKRYLYEPVLKAIDARESQVSKVLSDADMLKTDAELERNLFKQKNIEIDTKCDELLNQAKTAARGQSEQIVFQAHKNADEISKSRLLALNKELQHYQDDITIKMLQEIYEIARKVLADLADVDLEQKMLECFCKHLQSISPDEKTNLNKTIEAGNTGLILSSAFELTAAQIKNIDTILQNLTIQKVTTSNTNKQFQLKHQLKTELISGIELRSDEWKVTWNSEDYLKVLQTHFKQLLDEQRTIINSRINSQTTPLNTTLNPAKDSA
jgi:F-type H+-transporting ATPase subunit b